MSQNSDTHSTCDERLAREGEKATCCNCNPHEGCTLGMKPTKTPTQNEWEKGEWLKGMGLSGSQAEYILSVCAQLLADAGKEVIQKVEKISRAKIPSGVFYREQLNECRLVMYGYNTALDDVLATLREEDK